MGHDSTELRQPSEAEQLQMMFIEEFLIVECGRVVFVAPFAHETTFG